MICTGKPVTTSVRQNYCFYLFQKGYFSFQCNIIFKESQFKQSSIALYDPNDFWVSGRCFCTAWLADSMNKDIGSSFLNNFKKVFFGLFNLSKKIVELSSIMMSASLHDTPWFRRCFSNFEANRAK
jgi:hypothetical protein